MAGHTNETLIQEGYVPRLVEGRLAALMAAFGCVEITGPKWCGKTWTALSRAASVTKLDTPSERMAAEIDPALALMGNRPHLVDEWQEVPEVWDAVRRAVDDAGNERGMFLLTGSTQLNADKRKRVRHSGAGRIARLRMSPMTLLEMGESSGTVSLSGLFKGKFAPSRNDTELVQVASWCCRGGWPANIGRTDEEAFELSDQYIQAVLGDNVNVEGKSPQAAFAVMRALAVNASRATSRKTLIADMAGTGRMSEDTLTSYLQMLSRLFIVEELPGWEPPMRSKARVRISPRRYFADPSLAAALLDATPEKLLRDTQTLGDLFKNLVHHELSVFLSTYGGLGNSLHYYRDDKGLEVNFIVEHDGAWGAIEVKLSESKADDAARNLLRLRNKLAKNTAAQHTAPAFLAVIVGKGSLAYRRPDDVHVIPIATLAP